MKRLTSGKLSLSREAIRCLSADGLLLARGGGPTTVCNKTEDCDETVATRTMTGPGPDITDVTTGTISTAGAGCITILCTLLG